MNAKRGDDRLSTAGLGFSERLPAWNSGVWVVLGLAPAIGGTVTAGAAATLAGMTLILVFTIGLVMIALKPVLRAASALATTVFLATTGATVAVQLLESGAPQLAESLGVFTILMAANVLVLRQSLLVVRDEPLFDFGRSLLDAVGFAGIVIAIGAVRELLSSAALFGLDLGQFGVDAFGDPAIALIISGLLFALLRGCVGRFVNAPMGSPAKE